MDQMLLPDSVLEHALRVETFEEYLFNTISHLQKRPWQSEILPLQLLSHISSYQISCRHFQVVILLEILHENNLAHIL
jgi:hypothetical protein